MTVTGSHNAPPPAPSSARIRPLRPADADAVIAIDRDAGGRSRQGFFEKRLAHLASDPDAFIAFAAACGDSVVGFVFARLYEGEFGTEAPEAALDALGVSRDARRSGIGRRLLAAAEAAMRARGIKEVRTQVDWLDSALTGFFARMNFSLAPRIVLECPVGPVRARLRERPAPAEADFSGGGGGEFTTLSHDEIPIRSMTRGDLSSILRIDRHNAGRERHAYFTRKLAEAMDESGVRVSLVAEIDGEVCGCLMARVEFGEFGSVEAEAIIDTIGVDPGQSHKGVGTALMSQLMTNLGGLRVDRVRTELDWNHFGLLAFFDRMGFRPHCRLALRKAPI